MAEIRNEYGGCSIERCINFERREHFYVKFINWGTIYRPPQEFIYATGREADAELQKIAEQEYQSYLDNTLK